MLRPTRGGGTTTSIVNFEDWENIPVRVKILFGMMTKGNIPNGDRSRFSCERYKFFLDADFEISSKCCSVMKKAPAHNYAKKTGRKPMTAQMASESRLRTQQWLKNGCNGFDMKKPISNPMSFWTEQDVLLFIHEYKDQILKWRIEEIETAFNGMVYGNRIVNRQTGATICSIPTMPICSVYGEVVTDYAGQGQVEGQLTFADMGIFEKERPLLKTTGCDRTGCMFCGYGCHLEKPGEGRFERMKETHPRQYAYIMRGGHWEYRIFNFKGEEISLKHCSQEQIESWVAQNKDNIRFKIEKHGFYLDGTGLGFKEIIDWINEHGNLNIKY